MMFVEPDAIGQGVGRLLFTHTVETARALGFTRFTNDANPTPSPSTRPWAASRSAVCPPGRSPAGPSPSTSARFRSEVCFLAHVARSSPAPDCAGSPDRARRTCQTRLRQAGVRSTTETVRTVWTTDGRRGEVEWQDPRV
ncbi:hypothetical protein [Streptomyces sp. NPDC096142]|uniref:hypothetical protein n=1 Tax=Streptomyces sp. NPDC096142 TaxID=3366077 RepID=UPI003808DC1C